jgi:Protein of unknown function (DUF1565)
MKGWRGIAVKTRRHFLGLFALMLVATTAAGCGGSSGGSKVAPTPRCVRASDCSGALVCVQGFCVQQCVESKDCPSGERCIPATEGNSCQPPEKSTCVYNTECTQPLVCGVDRQCRAQCQGDVDCPSKQFCTPISKLCADPTIDKNIDPLTHDFIGAVDAGAGKDSAVVTHPDAGLADENSAQPEAYLVGPDAGKPDAPLTADLAPGVDSSGAVDRGVPGVDAPAPGPDVNLSFDAPALSAEGVVVTPSASVRQGQINVTITVTRAAGGLATAGLFDLGDLTVRAQAGSTDTSLILKASVPHGAALGKRTLKIATSAGVITSADVVEVTAITAGPTGVDTNAGSAGSPFLTLKQAILVADVGDTIHLMDGTYNIKGGETWGYVIPDNLTIAGDSTAGTVIDGVGATNNPNGFNASNALTLKTLTVQHFYYGIDMQKPSSTLTLQDVQLGNHSSTAIYVEQAATGATVNILGKGTLIDQPGQSAITVYNAPNVTANITDATLQGGSYVVYFAYNCSGSKLNITGATIKQLGSYNAIYMGISSNTTGTTATLTNATIVGNISYSDAKGGSMTVTGSTITQKSGNGIDFAAASLNMADTTITMSAANAGISLSGAQATMSLKGVTITGGGYGIQQSGAGSSAKLRGTTIQSTAYDAYILQAGDLDMGTATESGDNVIAAPSSTSYWCLDISRSQGSSGGNPVTCSGTTLNGLAPNPGTIDASAGTVSLQPQRYYLTTGNKLIFY